MAGRVFIIGVGGASSSGKTVLAKHILSVLPTSTLIHQDDFAPLEKNLPFTDDEPKVRDWDYAPTAIDWPKFRSALNHVKEHGTPPSNYDSFDHLNKQVEVGVDETIKEGWKRKFAGVNVRWCIVDGFVLYWDKAVVDMLDVKLFLRANPDVLRKRREQRQYATQTGDFWVDPPKYFERVVWPRYVQAHEHIFENGDVENGKAVGVRSLSPKDGDMTEAFEESCKEIYEQCTNLR